MDAVTSHGQRGFDSEYMRRQSDRLGGHHGAYRIIHGAAGDNHPGQQILQGEDAGWSAVRRCDHHRTDMLALKGIEHFVDRRCERARHWRTADDLIEPSSHQELRLIRTRHSMAGRILDGREGAQCFIHGLAVSRLCRPRSLARVFRAQG